MLELIIIICLSIIFIILFRRLPQAKIEKQPSLQDWAHKKSELAFGEIDSVFLDEDLYQVQTLVRKAEKAIVEKDFKSAEKNLLKAVVIDSKNPKIYGKLGVVFLGQKNFTDAREAFEMAIKLEPTNGFWYNDLGLALYNLGEFQAAIRAFKKALKIDDKIAARYINLGLVCEAVGNQEKALECFKKAYELDPKNEKYKSLIIKAAHRL